jgi:molybdopterin-containing oxidoreductase family iron-sulfur binding subunit
MARVSRRRFLTKAGGAGVLGAGVALAGPALVDRIAYADEAEGEPMRLRRSAFAIDLRKCDGCVDQGVPPQCTQYCIWGHSVPEDQQWIEVFDLSEVKEMPDIDVGVGFMPLLCQCCENAPCVNVCPVGACFSTPEGEVIIDQERCIGCRLCIAACPYDRIFFNWDDPVQLPEVKNSSYNMFYETPAIRGTVMKCDMCVSRTASGGLPFCVEGCPHGALYWGDLEEDIATNGREVVQLSYFLKENNAWRYKEELGTKPRTWYITGHSHEGEVSEGDERTFPTYHGQQFLKGQVEWPWRAIVAALEQDAARESQAAAKASGEERRDG